MLQKSVKEESQNLAFNIYALFNPNHKVCYAFCKGLN